MNAKQELSRIGHEARLAHGMMRTERRQEQVRLDRLKVRLLHMLKRANPGLHVSSAA